MISWFVLPSFFCFNTWQKCDVTLPRLLRVTISPSTPLTLFPNHYNTNLDPVLPAIIKDDSNIAYFHFQARRSVSLGWRFNERQNVATSKHLGEGWIIRTSYQLPLLSKVSQSNKSTQQYYLFDFYYDSWIRVPFDLWIWI